MSNSRTASSELSAAASLMRSELCEAARQLAAALAMASTLWIVIEPLLRLIKPRRYQFWKILFTLSRLPAASCRARAARRAVRPKDCEARADRRARRAAVILWRPATRDPGTSRPRPARSSVAADGKGF